MKKKFKWSSAQLMIVGFFGLIFAGGIILSLPICNADGKWLSFVDALFTSCTSACVTGLVTIVPATQFNLLGKFIILLLIQIGGWGVIVCGAYFMVMTKKQITMRIRVILQDLFGLEGVGGIVRFLKFIIKATVVVEGIGALCFAFQFVPQYGFIQGIWFSIFHSISAYCNAGIDILGDNSFAQYVLNPWMNFVTMGLIVLGGIGFLIYQDILDLIKNIFVYRKNVRKSLRQCKLQTKIVFSMTALLIFGGALLIYICERGNTNTLGNLSLRDQIIFCLFQSVTTRTAGFFTIDQTYLRPVTQFVCTVLMFIGGSPLGTAGGIKTVTIAVLWLSFLSILRGNYHVEAYRREIGFESIRVSISVFMSSLSISIVGVFLLSLFETNVSVMRCMYEVFSATATVGLTAGLTPTLCTASKILVIALMYLGRIGPITLPVLFVGRDKRSGYIERAEEHLLVG